jgi:NAD(P)-dependent dehydrogenase (short-subunit alcohol dehydrogenase family)
MTVSSTYSYTRNTYRRRTLRSIAPHHSPLPLGEGGRRPGDGAQPGPRAALERIARRTALGRLGLRADVVGAIDFLTTPAAGFITGQVLTIDGGS